MSEKPQNTGDSLPDIGERVLAFVPYQNGAYGCWFIASRGRAGWYDDSRESEELPWPSHWEKLPPSPIPFPLPQ